jgi:Domain of unknown function (DUF4126)
VDLSSATGSVFAAFGLSGSAGLNAWLPLFLSALLHRAGVVELAAPLDQLSSTAGLVVLGALMALDLVGDKVPVVDHALHVVGTAVAPASGAVLFAGQTGDTTDLPTLVAVLLGGGTAGAIHLGRSALRAASTATTGGFGNPVLSAAEDVGAGVLTLLAFALPVLAFLTVAALGVAVWLAVARLRARRGP